MNLVESSHAFHLILVLIKLSIVSLVRNFLPFVIIILILMSSAIIINSLIRLINITKSLLNKLTYLLNSIRLLRD